MTTRQTQRPFGLLVIPILMSFLAVFCGCEGGGSDGPDQDYNGSWAGNTSGGGEMHFVVSGDKVINLYLRHGSYTLTQNAGNSADISGNSFTIEHNTILENGQIVGTFATATQCSGTYSFTGNRLPGPVSFSGTFTANKAAAAQGVVIPAHDADAVATGQINASANPPVKSISLILGETK